MNFVTSNAAKVFRPRVLPSGGPSFQSRGIAVKPLRSPRPLHCNHVRACARRFGELNPVARYQVVNELLTTRTAYLVTIAFAESDADVFS